MAVSFFTLDKPSYSAGEIVTATFRIINFGSTATGRFWVDLYKSLTSPPTIGQTGDGFAQFESLPPGGLTPVGTWIFTAPISSGNHTAYLFADSRNDVAETAEFNNQATANYIVTAAALPDLRVVINSLQPISAAAGAQVTASVTVINDGGVPTPSGFFVSIYPQTPAGVCPDVSGAHTAPVGILAANGGSAPFSLTFTAPQTPGSYTAVAQADSFGTAPNCDILESNENNNRDTEPYTVASEAGWFETLDGGVGALGSITISRTPPAGRYHTTYLGVSKGSIDSDFRAAPTGWAFQYSNLASPPRSTYSYLFQQFGQNAQTINNGQVDLATARGGVNYYPGGGVFIWNSSNPITVASPTVIFINSDFRIQQNLKFAQPQATVVFIVAGDIKVHQNVGEINGLYLASGSFESKFEPSVAQDSVLAVEGSILAHGGVSLARDLGAGNSANPGERFKFNPKYLVDLAPVLGSPSYNWREVAP